MLLSVGFFKQTNIKKKIRRVCKNHTRQSPGKQKNSRVKSKYSPGTREAKFLLGIVKNPLGRVSPGLLQRGVSTSSSFALPASSSAGNSLTSCRKLIWMKRPEVSFRPIIIYKRGSRKQPSREFTKVVPTRAKSLTRMGYYKQPRNETIQGGRLRGLLAYINGD